MPHWLFLPDDAVEDLTVLASLSPELLTALRDYLDSNEFRPRYTFFVKVAELLNISDEAAAKLCTFINYVQGQRERQKKEGGAVLTEFEHFLARAAKEEGPSGEASKTLDKVKGKRSLLIRLFSDLPKYDFSEKVRGLETGPVPHLHGFRTFCDLRPVYNSAANQIVEYLPVITLWLVTHAAATDKYEEIVVQLAEPDVADLKEQIDRLDKKLALLRERHSLPAAPMKEDRT